MLVTYDLKRVPVTLDGQPVRGKKDDSITFAFPDDDWAVTQDVDGLVVRSRKPNNFLDCTLKLQQGSEGNAVLQGYWATDQQTGLGTFAFVCRDLLSAGTLVSAPKGFVLKRADMALHVEAGMREWPLVLPNPTVSESFQLPA